MKRFLRNEEGQAGVGTLIIFIAMVLVAAVAAAVLISTSGVMQSKSSTTTSEAASAVTENLKIISINGTIDSSKISRLDVFVKPAAGSSAINVSRLVVKVTSDTKSVTLIKGSTADATYFQINDIRGDTSDQYLDPNSDLADIQIDASNTGLNLTERSSLSISLIPEKGSTTEIKGLTLPAFGSKTTISIYP